MQGRKEEAVHTLNDLLYHQRLTQSVRKTRLLATLVYIHIISGELDEALVVDQQLYEFATEYNYPYAIAWSVYLKGLIHFYQNDLEGAISHFRQNMEDRYLLQTRAVVDSMAGLAFSYQATNQPDRANTTIQHLFKYVASLNQPAYSMIFQSCQARLLIMQGEIRSAIGCLGEDSSPAENMVWWLQIPAITYCRALLAEGSDESLVKTEAKLQELLKLNQDCHNTCQTIHILTLLAVAYQKQAKTEEALAAAEQAVMLAQPGGFIRPFLELGSPMVEMLKHLRKQKVAEDYISRILAAFKSEERPAFQEVSGSQRAQDKQGVPDRKTASTPQLATGHQATLSPDDTSNLWIEDLTQRELDVLTYLTEGLSNKEIGAKLFLSPLTVKKHLYNIYQKLDVHSRTGAINKARELGLLSLD
jgi:LuxR family maltose regulon positive regulatory protein